MCSGDENVETDVWSGKNGWSKEQNIASELCVEHEHVVMRRDDMHVIKEIIQWILADTDT